MRHLPLNSKIRRKHVLWTAGTKQSTHASYDDTAERTLAQNHHAKQNTKIETV